MTLQRTPLYEEHLKLNARMVPFAGWEMPVQYAGVLPEARACREGCGIFDVSHMGQIGISGGFDEPEVVQTLNRAVSSDWSKLPVNRAAYALLLDENGGVIDDIIGFQVQTNAWQLIVNASRAPIVEAHLQSFFPQDTFEGTFGGVSKSAAMIALQGPRAEAVLQSLLGPNLSVALAEMNWRDCCDAEIQGVVVTLMRGGYTGLDGFEFMFNAQDAPRVWRALLDAGATPCGLGARDALRLEAALPLYGHELREDLTPYESGCGWAVKMDKPDFIGKAALQNKQQPELRVRALQMESRAIPREGYGVFFNGERVGEVTSGTLSPALNIGIALALVPSTLEIGAQVEVEVRQAKHPARIVKPPFVPHGARK